MKRSTTTGEFKPWQPESVQLTAEAYRDRAAVLQRELRTSQRWTTGYRRLALAGWIAFTAVLLWQGDAHAETLPASSIACVDNAAWQSQQVAGDFVLVQGCVYAYRDYQVRVESPGVVWVGLGDKEQQVWVDSEVLRP